MSIFGRPRHSLKNILQHLSEIRAFQASSVRLSYATSGCFTLVEIHTWQGDLLNYSIILTPQLLLSRFMVQNRTRKDTVGSRLSDGGSDQIIRRSHPGQMTDKVSGMEDDRRG